MKKLFVVFLFFAMFFFAPIVEANGWLSGYYNRIKIPIDASKVDAALSNFPVLVKLTSANFDFSKANSDGYDFRFTAANGTTLLKYERERHDSTNKLAEYWVKVPSVSDSADTYIYLYYRTADTADGADPENVWDSNHKAVLHLKDNTTSSVLDSTANNNDGTKKGANEPQEVAGKIYKAQDFDGTDDYIDIGNMDSVNGISQITISGWVKRNSGFGALFYKQSTDINSWIEVAWHSSLGLLLVPAGGVNYAYVAIPAGDDWKSFDFVFDGTQDGNKNRAKIYINGSLQSANYEGTIASVTASPSGTAKIGRDLWNDATIDGLIDEVRISNVARSAAWIKASYHSGAGSLLKSFVNESLYGNFFLMF